MTFGENLSTIRHKQNITQDELAAYLKVSRSTIAGYETRNREPEYHILLKIADFFHVSTDYLLGHDTNAVSYPPTDMPADNVTTPAYDSALSSYSGISSDFLSIVSTLSDRDRRLLLSLAKAMQNNQA